MGTLHRRINKELQNSSEYLAWKRLHISKTRLTNITHISGIMAEFAVIAAVELNIPEDYFVDPTIIVFFVVTWSLQISLGMICLCISSTILPYIHSFIKSREIEEVGESPHEKLSRLIDISSVLAYTLSISLFILNVILMCWIQYDYFSRAASIAAIVTLTPVLLLSLLFGLVFYRKVMRHGYRIRVNRIRELEEMKEQFDRDCEIIATQQRSGMSSVNRIPSREQSLAKGSVKMSRVDTWNTV